MNKPLSFRSSRITYYGPHACENCGVSIVKMGHDFGGNAFTAPDPPIYPNTEWHVHVCDPADVLAQAGKHAKSLLATRYPQAVAVRVSHGWLIVDEDTVISCNQTYCDTEWTAWSSALDRVEKGYPTWPFPRQYKVLQQSA